MTRKRSSDGAPSVITAAVTGDDDGGGDGDGDGDGDGRGRGRGAGLAAAAARPTLGARAAALRDGHARGRGGSAAHWGGQGVRGAREGEGEGASEGEGANGGDDALKSVRGSSGARADSLAALLSQALRADDRALIERCLSVSDAVTIANTVAKLSSSVAMKLLTECATRAQAKPASGERCAKWARSILLYHAGYASEAPKARGVLMSLSQTLQSHVKMQESLNSLLGRLDLVLHASAESQDGDVAAAAEFGDDEHATALYDEATDTVHALHDVMVGIDDNKEDGERDDDVDSEDDDDDDGDDDAEESDSDDDGDDDDDDMAV